MTNTNEMKPLNMKRAKPKTYRDEISFCLMKMTLFSESLQLRWFLKPKNTLQLVNQDE